MWSFGARTDSRAANFGCRSLAAWLVLFYSAPLLIWGQSENASPPQLQAPSTSSSAHKPSEPQSSSKPSERIFGVVPAYNITDARSAPPLTPKQKFGLFAKGTLDPFPVAAYALQAGVSQARVLMLDTGKVLPAMENDLVLLYLTVHQRGFSALTRSHPCCTRILAIFGRAREVPAHERATLSLEAL
jgi:hypothetical protein